MVSKLIAEGPEVLKKVESGGGSPGGNVDVICGPLEALECLAATLDPDRDSFTLERDDDLVRAAFRRILYGAVVGHLRVETPRCLSYQGELQFSAPAATGAPKASRRRSSTEER